MTIREFCEEERFNPLTKKALTQFLDFHKQLFSKEDIELYSRSRDIQNTCNMNAKLFGIIKQIPTLHAYKKQHNKNQFLTCGIDHKIFQQAIDYLMNRFRSEKSKIFDSKYLEVTLYYSILLYQHKNLTYDDVKEYLPHISKPYFKKASLLYIEALKENGIVFFQSTYAFNYIIFPDSIYTISIDATKRIEPKVLYMIDLMQPLHKQIDKFLSNLYEKLSNDYQEDKNIFLGSIFFDEFLTNNKRINYYPLKLITDESTYLMTLFFNHINIYDRKLKTQYNFYFFLFLYGIQLKLQRICIMSIFALVLHKYVVAIQKLKREKYDLQGYLAGRYSNNIMDILLYHYTYNTYIKMTNIILVKDDYTKIYKCFNDEMSNLSSMLTQFVSTSLKISTQIEVKREISYPYDDDDDDDSSLPDLLKKAINRLFLDEDD